MKHLMIVVILGILAWQGYGRFHADNEARAGQTLVSSVRGLQSSSLAMNQTSGAATFSCDGRTYCSQMTSCAEATYFLKNCPGTRMDGNRDGVPCEKQWCRPGR